MMGKLVKRGNKHNLFIMSRSYKNPKSDHHKMMAYVPEKKQGQEKFEPTLSKFGKFSTRDDKLEAKNANRSLKKSVRQESKQGLRKYL
jgi:hypothetical protein